MNKKLSYILILLLPSCTNLVGPGSHGDSLGDGDSHPEPIGNSEIINAIDDTVWAYYKITEDSLLEMPDLGNEFITNPYEDYQVHTQADIVTSKVNLGFEPTVSLEQGIKAYIPEIKRLHGQDIS